jgi:hypothetical protein
MQDTVLTIGSAVMGLLILGFLIAQLVVSIRNEKALKDGTIEAEQVPPHTYEPSPLYFMRGACTVCGDGQDSPLHV